MKLKYQKIFPWILAVLPTFVTILALPWQFHEYEAVLVESFKGHNDFPCKRYFHDFDHDGLSERVNIGIHHPSFVPYFLIVNQNNINLEQENFRGKWLDNYEPVFADYNNNGFDEVYAFSERHDSLFICSFEVTDRADTSMGREKFISEVRRINEKEDWLVFPAQAADLNNDGFQEIIFAVNAAFSYQPRAVYAWDVKNDSLFRSPEAGFTIRHLIVDDADDDSDEEIYLFTSATANQPIGNNVQYTDHKNWAVVLNHELKFLFEPVAYNNSSASMNCIPFHNGKMAVVLVREFNLNADTSYQTIAFFSQGGQLLKRIVCPDGLSWGHVNQNGGNFTDNLFFDNTDQSFYKVNELFELEKISSAIEGEFRLSSLHAIDLGADGKMDIVATNLIDNSAIVFRNGFKDPVTIHLPVALNRSFTVRHRPPLPDQILVNNDNDSFLYEYRHNNLYFIKYPIWMLIYLFWLSFVFLILHYQRKRMQKAYAMENKINELQMINMSNQLNPHFIFNALTAISGLMFKKDSEGANNLLVRFSKLMRLSMQRPDKICWSLYDEFKFVEDYLTLEQSRFPGQFSWQVQYNESQSKGMEIPRLIVQNHAENALKHGLRHREAGGSLLVEMKKEDGFIQILIEDNGIGRVKARELGTGGTGKGLKLTEEIFALYSKLYQRKISQVISDLYDEHGRAAGTRVLIQIQLENKGRSSIDL